MTDVDDVAARLAKGFPTALVTDRVRHADVVTRAIRLRSEMRQIFTDVAHWNEHVREPHEAPIDPDPDGELTELIAAIDKLLERQTS